MIAGLAIAGTPAEARERFEDLAARDVVDDVIVSIPVGAGDELTARTVGELAPDER